MKNQITRIPKCVQNTMGVLLLLMISFSSFAQNPGGGNHPKPPHGGGGGNHPSLHCNAHFFHHRDSVVNGIRFYNLRGTGAATYAWDFGDGSSSTQSNPSHTYADSGRYVVCLTVTDTIRGGCTNTYCDTIRVFTPPPRCNAYFRARPDSVPNGVRFFTSRRGHSLPSPTATYSWDFGDGSGTSTLRNPAYTYADSGTYFVCLTVSNSNASGTCIKTYCDSVNTHSPRHRRHHRLSDNLKLEGIEENISEVSVSVYPNPMNESSTIHIENTTGNVTFRLFNMTGQVALTKELANGDNTINKDNLSVGLYFYTIEDGNTNVAKGKLQVY